MIFCSSARARAPQVLFLALEVFIVYVKHLLEYGVLRLRNLEHQSSYSL